MSAKRGCEVRVLAYARYRFQRLPQVVGSDFAVTEAKPAKPKAKKLPGVVVIHENRGLNPYIEDVARRVALEGYLASRLPWLTVAVPFYGQGVSADDAKKIKARLMLHFAGTDERVNGGWPDYKAALKAAKVRFEDFHYPDTQHGFHNDTTPRYDEKAAKLAWSRTSKFFKQYLH